MVLSVGKILWSTFSLNPGVMNLNSHLILYLEGEHLLKSDFGGQPAGCLDKPCYITLQYPIKPTTWGLSILGYKNIRVGTPPPSAPFISTFPQFLHRILLLDLYHMHCHSFWTIFFLLHVLIASASTYIAAPQRMGTLRTVRWLETDYLGVPSPWIILLWNSHLQAAKGKRQREKKQLLPV